MGSFFTNLQVFRDDINIKDMAAAIVNALEKVVADKYKLHDDDCIVPDRNIIISYSVADNWITIYDDLCENQDVSILDSLGKKLSNALDKVVASVMVSDSDTARMGIYHQGNRAMLFENTLGSLKTTVKDANQCMSILDTLKREDADLFELKGIWNTKEVFADSIIYKTCEFFRWNSTYAAIGYRYLGDIEAENKITLKFAFKNREKSAAIKTGLPQLSFRNRLMKCAAVTNTIYGTFAFTDTDDYFNAELSSIGGESQGMKFYFWGPAVHAGCIKAKDIEVINNFTGEKYKSDYEFKQTEDQNFYYVVFPDIIINPGLDRGLKYPIQYKGRTIGDEESTFYSIRTSFVYEKEGQGKYYLSAVPFQNEADGGTGISEFVEIKKACKKPIKLIESRHQLSCMHQINRPNTIFAQIICEGIKVDHLEEIKEVFLEWHNTIFIDKESIYHIWSCEEQGSSADICWVKGEQIHKSTKVKKTFSDMNKGYLISFELRDKSSKNEYVGDWNKEYYRASGFAFYPGCKQEKSTPVQGVTLWFDLTQTKPYNKEEIEDKLKEIVNDTMRKYKGIQAYIGTWDENPPIRLYHNNPYEILWGIDWDIKNPSTIEDIKVISSKSWCSRYLRAVTEHLWISKGLVGLVEDFDKVEDLCIVESYEDFVLLELRSIDDYRELEKRLSKIIPDKQAFESFLGEFHG